MPVRSTKSDMMLNSQSDNLFDVSLYSNSLDYSDFEMKFLETDTSDFSENCNAFDNTTFDFSDIVGLGPPSSPKYQIRNHDCMWSGTCVDKSHPSKKRGLHLCSASTSSTTVTNQPQSTETCTTTTQKPSEKFVVAKNIMTQSSIMKTIACKGKIPAGSSLLINSRINTNTAPTKTNQQIREAKSIECSSKDFDTLINANLRPDTPLSLGDDVPEFKNNIDLTPCPSSNRVKFNDPNRFTDTNAAKYINLLVEQLEDPNETPNIGAFGHQRNTANDLNDILTDITFLSDYEDLGDESVDLDDDEEDDFKDMRFTKMHPSSAMSQASSSRTHSQFEFISDHSYTRQKGSRYDLDTLGVQTPSDSEEEIDVVNLSEKNLPTNPSARDRRALQTTVAHKIARSKHPHQRRRVSDDDSISSSTSTLSSKGSTPIKIGSQTPNRYVFSAGHSRKRKDNNNNMRDSHKKYRHSKKQRMSHKQLEKQVDPEEAETAEKRNLHNNMERQRRIGLKNLFEELKCQIPSLKDKERAPKVNILREAASYCTKLRRDEDLHAELTKKHNRLMTRVRNLKASIAAQQRRNY